jgi:hypothetical protein
MFHLSRFFYVLHTPSVRLFNFAYSIKFSAALFIFSCFLHATPYHLPQAAPAMLAIAGLGASSKTYVL